MEEKLNIHLAHHHTAICCGYWKNTVEFYQKLGYILENDWYWPDGVKNHKSLLSFQRQKDCWLELFEYPEGRNGLTPRYTDSAGCVFEFALKCCSDEAIDSVFQYALDEMGAKAVLTPRNYEYEGTKGTWKLRKATIAGPDGEHITFIHSRGEETEDVFKGISGFHHNSLHVAELEKSVDFYEKMGFTAVDVYKDDSGVRFSLMRLPNGNGLLLKEDGKEGLPTDIERMRAAGSMFQYCFGIENAEDIEAIYDYSLIIGGRERIKPFWHESYGMASWKDHPAFTYGPDNEILEFLYIDYNIGDNNG